GERDCDASVQRQSEDAGAHELRPQRGGHPGPEVAPDLRGGVAAGEERRLASPALGKAGRSERGVNGEGERSRSSDPALSNFLRAQAGPAEKAVQDRKLGNRERVSLRQRGADTDAIKKEENDPLGPGV